MTATVAIDELVFRFRRSSPGGVGFQKGDLTRVSGGTAATLADFEANHPLLPERYSGPIDHPEDVGCVDISPAQDFSDPPVINLTVADINARFGFTSDEQIEVSIYELGMPKGRRQFETDGLIGPVKAVHRIWSSTEIDKWEAILHRVFPALAKR